MSNSNLSDIEESKENENVSSASSRRDDQDEETEKGIRLIRPKSKGRLFRVQSKSLFLTYPKNTTEPDDLLGFISDRLKKWEPTYIGVVRELHKSGEPHLHAVVILKEKCDIRDGNAYFRYKDTAGVNIGVVRSIDRSIKYISKDGEPLEYGKRPVPKKDGITRKQICERVV